MVITPPLNQDNQYVSVDMTPDPRRENDYEKYKWNSDGFDKSNGNSMFKKEQNELDTNGNRIHLIVDTQNQDDLQDLTEYNNYV